MIEFLTTPEIGTTMALDGQAYHLIGFEDYVTKAGAQTKLLRWQADCPECGEAFFVRTGRKFKSPNRRCAQCKTPGKTVRGKRGRTVTILVTPPQS